MVRDAAGGGELTVRAANVVNATGVWADRLRPEELHGEAEVPVIRPSRGTHVLVSERGAAGARGRDRPGGRRAERVRAPVARPDADRHDRQRLRRRHRARAALARTTSPTCSTPATASSGRRSRPADAVGAYAGVRPLIAHRRPEEVRRHLAQGRALRDVERHGHDHRRQADHVAADGQAGGRPDRRARGPPGAVPHARDPARARGGGGRAPAGRGRAGGGLRAARRPLRLRRARRADARRRAGRARPAGRWPACRTCSPRRPSPRGGSRRTRSATCCCAGRGWG